MGVCGLNDVLPGGRSEGFVRRRHLRVQEMRILLESENLFWEEEIIRLFCGETVKDFKAGDWL